MITVSPLFHKGQKNIKIEFGFDSSILTKIKSLGIAKYSATHKCWYIPYDKEAFRILKTLGIPYIINQDEVSTQLNALNTSNPNNVLHGLGQKLGSLDGQTYNSIEVDHLSIEYNSQSFYIRLPYRPDDINILKGLSGSYWSHKNGMWVVRATPLNTKAIQAHFLYWNADDFSKIVELVHIATDPVIVELYRSPEYLDHFLVKLKGYRPDYSFMKGLPSSAYDKEHHRWIIPLSKDNIERVSEHYTSLGAKLVDRLPKLDADYVSQVLMLKDKQSYLLNKYPETFKPTLVMYTDTMIRQKYSWSTVTSYIGPFHKFLSYLHPLSIDDIEVCKVNDYLVTLAAGKMSDSLLNTAINALKFYFEKVVFRPEFKIEQIKRPRKGRNLPSVLSISEVDRLLRSTENLKHATILYAFYGCGLRLNELLSLRVNDVWWDRNQLMIKNGKGGKDRVVMLSETLKQLLKTYFDQYQPQYWLFEGQDQKHQYSDTSVQKIVKQAAKKACITRKVSPHTLRHCFATHLMDGGIQLPYIQELLGHKDIKTTLIYTHVTTHNATTVVSPLDQLKISIPSIKSKAYKQNPKQLP